MSLAIYSQVRSLRLESMTLTPLPAPPMRLLVFLPRLPTPVLTIDGQHPVTDTKLLFGCETVADN